MHPLRLIPGLLAASPYSLRAMSSAVDAPSYVELPATSRHSATVILLHGLGDSGNGLKPVAAHLQSQAGLGHCKFILPNAPIRPVTVNGNRLTPAWFNTRSFSPPSADFEEDQLHTLASIEKLIATELGAGPVTDPARIVVGGFSQGGVMSVLVGVVSEIRIAGIAVMSGRLPLRNAAMEFPRLKELASPHASSLAVWWGHGLADEMLKVAFAETAVSFLTNEIGIPRDGKSGLVFRTYPGLGHGIGAEEMRDLGHWLEGILPAE
ncbi:unnamed protein product [Mycena citricolor]|uniref:Acyl-protein thioesterase 1 n=1 Tax=Mycena citricolor TaxID=2018698 RepID=A0AAD2HR82_9AGAR|nr:unnamed protein product [Mycena citricolor]